MKTRRIHKITKQFLAVVALLLASLVTSDCLADCIACWQLKGVLVRLKDGTTIDGYATWNDGWATLGYLGSNAQGQRSLKQIIETQKEFPEVILDPAADIDSIGIYTHLRSIEYPLAKGLVTTRDPIQVKVREIQDLKLNPGPHDGYHGAGSLPLVSPRIADLLQTKPEASCDYDDGGADVYWVSYDKSFPAEELRRLCEQRVTGEETDKLEGRDIISLYFFYD